MKKFFMIALGVIVIVSIFQFVMTSKEGPTQNTAGAGNPMSVREDMPVSKSTSPSVQQAPADAKEQAPLQQNNKTDTQKKLKPDYDPPTHNPILVM